MGNRILADIILVIHLAWIIFMLYGFALTVRAFWRPAFWDRWLFRTIHLAGILFVAALELLGKYCPLTVLENAMLRRHDPASGYTGDFIIHYLEQIVYPRVDPILIIAPTVAIAAFTLLMFIIKPPSRLLASHRTQKSD